MKTIKFNDGTFKRVEDSIADHEVNFGRASYVPKSEWKKSVRGVAVSEEIKVAEIKGQETKSKKADKAAKLKEKQRH